ncbi:sarcosine oxidase subunit delta [Thiomicrospira sp. WB1]|uniref:sarcosine oxidase subunit delta n=1 Tax=Thiomicrospira sp. WB1 TaxID=1685380 RepID=UPI000747F9C7|nr:sarcosine oxidase subunit delta [Thiomicrospira sp. WB1]KUJ72493.1 sarcosine oxidase subunit delta [Thiomicrospira sp. WB1]
MKFVECAPIGRRALSEFVYAGPVRKEPRNETVSDADLSEFLYYHWNQPAVQTELWQHRPTGIWFYFERDTATDRIERVYPATKGAAQ